MEERTPSGICHLIRHTMFGIMERYWHFIAKSISNIQDAYLASKTLCLLGVQVNGNQRLYNTKNLYGWSEARATQQALWQSTGKRGAIVSR